MEKVLKTLIALRRDNHYNIKDDLVLKKGEVIFVDKIGGLYAKIGDGTTQFKDLEYDMGGIIVRGYLKDNTFYVDAEYKTSIKGIPNGLYIEAEKSRIYLFDGTNYIPFDNFMQGATAEVSGVMKLYQTTGENTDGAMSQLATSTELKKKVEASVDTDDEMLVLSFG